MTKLLASLDLADAAGGPLYSRIASELCKAVKEGKLEAGDQLPTEMSLARTLGIHRLTVSKAYEQLRTRKLIHRRRGSGTFIAQGAVELLQREAHRKFDVIHVIAGQDSLAKNPRETVFIITDILAGVRDVLGPRDAMFSFMAELDAASLNQIKDSDAILYMLLRQVPEPHLVSQLRSRGVPMVSLWDDAPLAQDISHITYDRQAARLCCQHLLDFGYRRIGFIGRKNLVQGPPSIKFNSYVNVLHDAGLDVRANHVRDVPSNPGRAYMATRQIIETGDLPDAFFVDTDYKALEVICALNEAGLDVPGDIGIVAYDGIPEAARHSPALTTLQVPRYQIGCAAAHLLLNTDGSPEIAHHVLLPADLICRASTIRQPKTIPKPRPVKRRRDRSP